MCDNFNKFMLNMLVDFRGEDRKEPTEEEIKEGKKVLDNIIDGLMKREIPETYPDIVRVPSYRDMSVDAVSMYEYRDNIIGAGGYSLVSYDWIRILKEKIIKDGKCLEIMAGSGMLSKALKDVGVDIITTDDKSWLTEDYTYLSFEDWFMRPFTEVEKLDCVDAIQKYGKDVDYVLVSWPYMNNACYKALVTMRIVNPNCTMIYIGELGDACADEDFVCTSKVLYKDGLFDGKDLSPDGKELYNSLEEVRELFKSWYGIHDNIYIIK